jgi:hypothetical protein
MASTSYIDLSSKISVPHTEISNRAQIVDLANDLMPRLGINRIQTQQLKEMPKELGPNGEKVFGVVNDKFDQIRFVGDWQISSTNSDGPGVKAAPNTVITDDHFIEFTFYGTGANLLVRTAGSASDLDIEVDGTPYSSISNGNQATITVSRNYSTNQIFKMADNLTLGTHTIKIIGRSGNVGGADIYGFEILNEDTQIKVNPGKAFLNDMRITKSTQESVDYASGFDNEYGTSGTKGGAVVTYLKTDGSVGKDIRYTEVSQLNLGAADHTNEEVISEYYPREFGMGRADDFTTLVGSNADRAFTLDDGVTSLIGNDVRGVNNSENLGFFAGAANGYFTFTFVGTGLDINYTADFTGTADAHTVYIDGVSVGTLNLPVTNSIIDRATIVSGLPYGTHTVRINRDIVSAGGLFINKFLVYSPKKPEVPSNTIPLGSYYLMSDFSQTTEGRDHVSSGVLRRQITREMAYTGSGWSISAVAPTITISGFSAQSTTLNDKITIGFWGVGFDVRINSEANVTYTLSVDGSSDFSSLTTNLNGAGGTWTPGAGTLSGNTGIGASLSVEGLALDYHEFEIEITTASGGALALDAFDVITPIHSPKLNEEFMLQNSLTVGNQSIGDDRGFDFGQQFKISESRSIGGDSTTSTTLLPMKYMLAPIELDSDGLLEIDFQTIFRANGGGNFLDMEVYMDGKSIQPVFVRPIQASSAGEWQPVSFNFVREVSAGHHFVQIFWKAEASSVEDNGQSKLTLKVLRDR